MPEELEELRQKSHKQPNKNELKEELAQKLFDTTIELAESGKNEKAIELVLEMEELAKNNLTNNTILLYYGQTILNILTIYVGRTTITDLKNRINIMREIVSQSENKKLEEFLAMTIVNGIYDFSLSNHTPSVHEYAIELMDLFRANPINFKIQTACAKGMMNAVTYFMQQNDIQAAKKYFEHLMKVVEANPKEEMVDSKRLIDLKQHFGYNK